MQKLTLKQTKHDCVKMWDWLRKNPLGSKFDFVEQHPEYPDYQANCACCAYDSQQSSDYCDSCPIEWITTERFSSCGSSFYAKWNMTALVKAHTRTMYATEILKLALQIKINGEKTK